MIDRLLHPHLLGVRVRVGKNADELAIDIAGVRHRGHARRRQQRHLDRNAEAPERLLIDSPLPFAFVSGVRLVRGHDQRLYRLRPEASRHHGKRCEQSRDQEDLRGFAWTVAGSLGITECHGLRSQNESPGSGVHSVASTSRIVRNNITATVHLIHKAWVFDSGRSLSALPP